MKVVEKEVWEAVYKMVQKEMAALKSLTEKWVTNLHQASNKEEGHKVKWEGDSKMA